LNLEAAGAAGTQQEGGFLKAALSCWALFLGFASMVLGHGLLGSQIDKGDRHSV
jgi:hypothetical protein